MTFCRGIVRERFGALEASWWPDAATFLSLWDRRSADAASRARENGVRAMFVREIIVLPVDATARIC